MEYRHGSHTAYNIEYHFVWATKYRKNILRGDVAARTRELVRQTCDAFEIKILKGVVSGDHVHILVSAPPTIAPSEIMRRIKGRSLDCTQEGGQGVKSYLGLMILGRKLSRGQVPQTGVQPPFVVQRNECPNTLTGFVQISVFL